MSLPASPTGDASASEVGRIHGKSQAYMKRTLVSRIAAAAAILAALIAFSGSASAADTGTITLHSRLCPNGQPTSDIFTDCHSHLPTLTTTYSLDGGAAQAVGADGNLS